MQSNYEESSGFSDNRGKSFYTTFHEEKGAQGNKKEIPTCHQCRIKKMIISSLRGAVCNGVGEDDEEVN